MAHRQTNGMNGFPVPMTTTGSVFTGPRPPVDQSAAPRHLALPFRNPSTLRPRRQPTLSRPERQRSTRRPMMRDPNAAPPAARVGATTHRPLTLPIDEPPAHTPPFDCWTCFNRSATLPCLPVCLRWAGMHDLKVQHAWREKVALCLIILTMCVSLGYITFGFKDTVCPEADLRSSGEALSFFDLSGKRSVRPDTVTAFGIGYDIGDMTDLLKGNGVALNPADWGSGDITLIFAPKSSACSGLVTVDAASCQAASPVSKSAILRGPTGCLDPGILNKIPVKGRIAFGWSNLGKSPSYTVYNGAVIDLALAEANGGVNLLNAIPDAIAESRSRDGTKQLSITSTTTQSAQCLESRFLVGFVDKETPGCFASQVVTIVSLIIILSVVLIRFFMACLFSWFLSHKLTVPTGLPVTPGTNSQIPASRVVDSLGHSEFLGPDGTLVPMGVSSEYENDLYTILLVTCYSEGEAGIQASLESIAMTDFPDDKKLLFFVADGIITGSGNDLPTPDIILGLFDQCREYVDPEAMSYLAIADGFKQHNMARIYAGYFNKDGRSIPMITIVKCGTTAESKSAKPGNRGKRDSQLILMNFLSRVMFDDRMTPFDYDLFTKIKALTGVTPDKYEIVLMIDADTVVLPDSLRHLVNAMKNDNLIMGLCGETRIANKAASWTSMIQVFEYYISHHLSKAFESVFGGVTCLPGCFCMYRIKARKGPSNHWVPVLVNPDIVEEYSENVVETLHKKNLLLLGEDRFLTTLMLRNFPKRKMVFVPQAVCKTQVPDEFKVLLSQRRRWINSTIHNLLELVLVRDLCGIFCFSMQFVVMMELIGTVVLPAAIIFTIYLIVVTFVGTAQILPLLMLAAILGLPGLLVLITTGKIVYLGWMIIYLFALPIWNFVLPVYAFWHFDDFSWGETRKVEGEIGGHDHSKKDGVFDANSVQLKRWHEWEKERRIGKIQGRGDSMSTSTLLNSNSDVEITKPPTVSSIPSNAIPFSMMRMSSMPMVSSYPAQQQQQQQKQGYSPSTPPNTNVSIGPRPSLYSSSSMSSGNTTNQNMTTSPPLLASMPQMSSFAAPPRRQSHQPFAVDRSLPPIVDRRDSVQSNSTTASSTIMGRFPPSGPRDYPMVSTLPPNAFPVQTSLPPSAIPVSSASFLGQPQRQQFFPQSGPGAPSVAAPPRNANRGPRPFPGNGNLNPNDGNSRRY